MIVHLHFGDVCNMTCSYCITRVHVKQCMTSHVADAAVRFLNSAGVDVVILQGGEPTVWPHAVNCARALTCSRLKILTNGLLSDKLAELINAASDKQVIVTVSVHHDYWLAHRNEYVTAVLTDCKLLTDAGVDFNVKLLVDVEDMQTSTEIFAWAVANIDHTRLNVDLVRHSETETERFRTLLALRRNKVMWPLVNKLNPALLTDRRENVFYGKPCQHFTNFMVVQANGDVYSSLCAQRVFGGNVVDKFTLTPSTVICKQATVGCAGDCYTCNGIKLRGSNGDVL